MSGRCTDAVKLQFGGESEMKERSLKNPLPGLLNCMQPGHPVPQRWKGKLSARQRAWEPRNFSTAGRVRK